MFPGLKEDVIARVVSSTLTTEEAVDTVLKIQACRAMNESDEGKVLSMQTQSVASNFNSTDHSASFLTLMN